MREFRIINADVLDGLRGLPSESVHCCVTSPPYWGLRDYGVSGQLGLERTPEEYTARMVEVFAEVRRVLRADGTCWMNLGDSYTGSANAGGEMTRTCNSPPNARDRNLPTKSGNGLKPKDLVGIPWRVAFALQADGWYLRSDIIWHKPNPMPESVTDRPTKAHEYLFLLTKSERYAYDADAIREPHVRQWDETNGGNMADSGHKKNGRIETRQTHPKGYPLPNPLGRNRRTVWPIATEACAEAHFAVMPTALVEPCVMAGCPEGGTVLDPFAGSGTVGVVALRHARNFVGIELNPVYAEMARNRIMDDAPMFNSEVA